MLTTLALAVGVVVLAASCSAPTTVTDVSALANEAGAAVWKVDATGCGWRSRGSAFAIDQRHLLTNRHVVANDSSPELVSRDGRKMQGKVIGAKAHPDVALIEVSEDLGETLGWADTRDLHAREPVLVIGYPRPQHTFKVSTGQIVDFQGPPGVREAALSNVPIDFGNSGGPGLRADGSVSGLVTQMALSSDPADRVAILFTAQAVRASVDAFLAQPEKVLSTCGLGPDYVPPVPKAYEIEAPPPAATPVDGISLPTQPPATAPPATVAAVPVATAEPTKGPATPVPCPQGRPVVRIHEVAATEKDGSPGTWVVDARGDVTNESTRNVHVERIDVRFAGQPEVVAAALPSRHALEPRGFAAWELQGVEVISEQQPAASTTDATAVFRWSSGDLAHCPTA